MKGETWKDIEGFEGRYQVSNNGKVKSVKAYNKCSYSKILKGRKTRKGYLRVQLGENNDKYIHRLVASAFVDNPNGYNEVNHIDFNKSNNDHTNLEWCTHKQNMKHAIESGRIVFSDDVRKTISIKRKLYWKNKKNGNK